MQAYTKTTVYTLYKKHHSILRVVILSGAVFAVAAVVAFAAYTFWPIPDPVEDKVVAQTAPTYAVSVESNTLFAGDIYLGRSMNLWAMASPLKYEYPFSRLSEFDRESYDAWIANLECPTVAGLNLTPVYEEATLSFNCNPEYLPELAKWFDVVTLANNHTDNQGLDGYTETQRHLDENGVQYFGHPDPRELNDLCDVIALPAHITMSDNSTQQGSLPVAMCGYHAFIRLPAADAVAVIQQYGSYMPVIAMPHGGTEYTAEPGSVIQKLYRSMIDNGADIVIGNHPHWAQVTEGYRGHPIIYSMGNFIFDQQWSAEVMRAAAIQVRFSVADADKELLQDWLALGDSCAAYHDDCLDKIMQAGLTKLPYTFQLGAIGVDTSGKITHAASAELTASILERLRWTQTMQQLQAPYSSL